MRAVIFLASFVLAQFDPVLDWSVGLSDQDRQTLRSAVVAMEGSSGDPTLPARIKTALEAIDGKMAFNVRMMPFLGMALSYASKDPAACALLRRIEPTSVCVQ